MLSSRQIDVFYQSKQVLFSVDLDLTEGRITGVIGPNGAGKSTLIRALSGIIPVRTGEVFLDGKPLYQLSDMQRARQVAVVSQAVTLPPAFTGWEVVLLGRTPYLNWLGQVCQNDRNRAMEAMEFTDTRYLADQRLGELSGGERQRLLLARALTQDTPILLMDEPTTHLDLHHQYQILEKLRVLARDFHKTILITLHDINLVARYSDMVVLMDNGRIKKIGEPQEVLQSKLLSEIYQTPLKVVNEGATPYILPVY